MIQSWSLTNVLLRFGFSRQKRKHIAADVRVERTFRVFASSSTWHGEKHLSEYEGEQKLWAAVDRVVELAMKPGGKRGGEGDGKRGCGGEGVAHGELRRCTF